MRELTTTQASGLPNLTRIQWHVLGFMKAYFKREDRLPTKEQICAHFNWASANAAQTHIDALARKGLIEKRDGGKYRFSRLPLTRLQLEDQVLELHIQANGLQLEAARLAAAEGCHFASEGDASRYLRLQADLVEARRPVVVLQMELERGIDAGALLATPATAQEGAVRA